jgi:hypothetical protein
MATPNDSTKPSNTQRANAVARRRVWSKLADWKVLNMAKLSSIASFDLLKPSF